MTERTKRMILGLSLSACLALMFGPAAVVAEPILEVGRTVRVADTFDDQAFSYRVDDSREEAGYTVFELSYPSSVRTEYPPNNTIPAEYYVPRGMENDASPRPAVICMHILDGNFALVRMTCSILANNGIPAIMFKLPYYGERGFPEGPMALAEDPQLFVEALSQSVVDVRRTVDLMQAQPGIASEHVGITGISLGGIVSATAAALDPRIDRAMLVLAGGNLNYILHQADETEVLSQKILALPPAQQQAITGAVTAIEPLRYADRLRERARGGRILMVNATDDATIPRECTEQLADALDLTDEVVWLDGLGHYTAMASLPQILHRTVDFFGQDLPPDVEIPDLVVDTQSPHRVIVSVIQQLVTMFTEEPDPGHAHFLDVRFTAIPPAPVDDPQASMTPLTGSLRIVRGPNEQLRVEGDIPEFGRVELGQSEHPWLVLNGERLLVGTQSAEEPTRAMSFVDPNHLLNVRMITGAATALSMAPTVLNQMMAITDETLDTGPRTILVMANDPRYGGARVVFDEDGRTPREIPFRLGLLRGQVTVQAMSTNTIVHPAIFTPPGGLSTQEASRADIQRVFASLLNFAGDQVFLPPPD